MKKDIYLVSSKSLLYALIFGRNMHISLILGPLELMKDLKLFLPNETILDTTVFDIFIFYWNRSNFFFDFKIIIFVYAFKKFYIFFLTYNVLLFLIKSAFCMNHMLVCYKYLVFFPMQSNFFWNMSNSKTIIVSYIFTIHIWCFPMSSYWLILIKIYYICPILYFRYIFFLNQRH